MEPKTPLNSTTGLAILTMSVIVLILGAASAFSIQEFAVPALDDESVELGVVLGDVRAGEVLFMLVVMAGLSVVFFAGPMGREKAYGFEDE